MNALIDVIFPVFVVIGLGYAAARAGLFKEQTVDGVMRYAQNFAVPCLLFSSIARLDLGANYDFGLLGSFFFAAFASFGAGYLGARYLFGRAVIDSVAIGFASYFSNSLLLGLPITERAYGHDALAGNYVILSIHAPTLYIVGITIMELAQSHGRNLAPRALARQVLKGIFTQPMVLGVVSGLLVNLSGLPQPVAIMAGVDMLGKSAIPAALFGLGGVLLRYRPEGDLRAIAMVCAISLMLHPGLTYLLGRHVFALDTAHLRSAVMTAAMPPGVNAYMFAAMYGVGMRVAASAVLLATFASMLSIWFWLQILP